ncbi:MAG: CaiB/BaiF CoA transferase family protein [Gammaproteobacteria bacterium]
MPLDGIRVLDFSQYLAGAGVTRLMAELGADIIKVEPAPGGDGGRLLPFFRDGRSGFFVQQNRGKRSLGLDLRRPEAIRICLELARDVDVIVENYGPGVMERRGLTYDAFKAVSPRVIMASVSAFGRDSPLAHKTGFDWIIQAFAGFMHMTGPREGPPHPVSVAFCDGTSALNAYGAVMTALFHRERTGCGQYLDISMVDSLFQMHEVNVEGASLTDGAWDPHRIGSHHDLVCPMGVFKGPTGYLVIMVLDMQWKAMCDAMGRPDLAGKPGYLTGQARAERRGEIVALIEHWLAGFPTNEEALAVLERHRVAAGPVLSPREALDHPYFVERGAVRVIRDPILGEFKVPGFPMRFSEQPELPELVAPLLGQHNRELLREKLGYSDARIRALEADGVLVSGPT